MTVTDTSIAGALDLPPEEALKFFRGKGLTASFNYQDVVREEHAMGFTVAKMTDLDLLADTRTAVDKALAEGQTFEQFRGGLMPTLQARGWWGRQVVTDPETGAETVAQLGSSRRLQTIFQTNLSTSYAAGNWAQVEENAKEAPYLMYDAILDDRTRPEHRAWDGTVLRYDDPWWGSHTPPCGYNCRCSVVQLSGDEAKRRGLQTDLPAPPSPTREVVNSRTGEVSQVPVGVDPGFDYNPGKLTRDARSAQVFAEKVAGTDAELGAAAYYQMRSTVQPSVETLFAAWVRTVFKAKFDDGAGGQVVAPQRRWQIAGAMHPRDVAFLKAKGLAPVTAEIAIEDRLLLNPKQGRHAARGNALSTADWEKLPRAFSNPDAVLFDTSDGKLLYIYGFGDPKMKAVISPDLQTKLPKRTLNSVVAAFKVPVHNLRDRRYELVRGELK